VERLKLVLNFQVKSWCTDQCSFHNYPYIAVSIINGKKFTIENEEQLWDHIMEVYEDCKKSPNGINKYKDLDLAETLPFFACPNLIYDANINEDISKYHYCVASNTSPYSTYGNTTQLWIDKFFTFKRIQDLKENRQIERKTRSLKSKGKPLK
tara:strand:- start:165 stop:623 length:459 start_codon:yes stop_codon:yes gene_type:complete